ncbi:SAV_915 family protein [Streptomyces sp. NBC_00239]|uniref:SAV_915 family protein n=1 Tax=Streptomyces sp. NBC_00239 TaxID=2903640 RepID=UPI002E2AEEEB|nr:SAV_915 family protein [Streptomyces sp. NBC_00239]
MCLFQYDDDPEPEERIPAGPLYVPVRPGGAEVVVRLFRTPLGARTAVGFTGPDRLAATFGGEQPWIRLSEAALRALTEPLGASLLTVDPTFTAPAVAREPSVAGSLPEESSIAARTA